MQEIAKHLYLHDDGKKVHEHNHGGKGNILVSTIGLVIHSIADGVALGASLYCINTFYILIQIFSEHKKHSILRSWTIDIFRNLTP